MARFGTFVKLPAWPEGNRFPARHCALPARHCAFRFRACIAPVAVFLAQTVTAAALTLTGTVVDPQENPVAEASVWSNQNYDIHRTTTDASGAFHISELGVGSTEVVALKEGLAIGGYSAFMIGDATAKIRLDTPDTLAIRVVNPEFLPVAGARVKSLRVANQFLAAAEDLVPEGFPLWRSNDEGILELPMMPKDGFVQLVITHFKYADSSVAYLPVSGKRQDIVLYRGATLRGRVTKGESGLGRARVSVYRVAVGGQREYAEAVTDPEGFYSARVPEGEYLVAAYHPDWASPEPQSVAIREGNGGNVADVAMLRPRMIEGSVVLPDGSPCEAVRIAYKVGRTIYQDTLSSREGSFRLKVGSPKGLILVGPPPGYMPDDLPEIPVDMADAYHVTITPIRLHPLPTISGSVLDTGGNPAANVLIASQNLPAPIWTITNENGEFQLRLPYAPDAPKVVLRAEHALRFLRQDFQVSLKRLKPATVKLKAYTPEAGERPLVPGRNDLSRLAGKPAPEIRCQDWFNTQPLTAQSLKGKVIVLTLWGGFDESPLGVNRIEELRALHVLLRDVDDVLFLAVHDAGSERDEVEEYVRRFGIPFAVGRDADPFVTFVNYGVNFIPQTVLIDKQGVLRYFQVEGRLLELIKLLRRKA